MSCTRPCATTLPNPRVRIPQARLEAARRDASDADCTFSPELVATKAVKVARKGSVFEDLYKKVWGGLCTTNAAYGPRV